MVRKIINTVVKPIIIIIIKLPNFTCWGTAWYMVLGIIKILLVMALAGTWYLVHGTWYFIKTLLVMALAGTWPSARREAATVA